MKDNSLEYSEWVKRGVMLIRRESLPINDSESIPSLWRKKFGSLDNFPWDEVYPGENIEKQLAVAETIPTSILIQEFNRRHENGEI